MMCDNITNTNRFIPSKVANIAEYSPNIGEYKIRLDANECPFEPTDEIMDEFSKALKEIEFNRYPDPFANKLLNEISKTYNIPTENLVVGNGSDELISLICAGFTEPNDIVTVALPDFSMYEFYSSFSGAQVFHYYKEENFDLDLEKLSIYVNNNRSKIVILSNPCNPTGDCKSRAEIEKFIKSTDALVVIDEAYIEFSDNQTCIFEDADKFENLIVLKTLSKAYGMAAIRLGIATSNREIISAIRKIKSPYNVNSVTQEFARIIIQHRAEIQERAKLISFETQKMADAISDIKSKNVNFVKKTQANFVLVKLSSSAVASEITRKMAEKGIAIRCFSNIPGIRISCGTAFENETVICEFVKILNEIDSRTEN